MVWTDNTIMFWHNGASFVKVSDHGRAPLDVSVERKERISDMVDGTLRRYTVAKKRTWTTSWENLPNKIHSNQLYLQVVDGGMSGEQMEAFHNTTDGAFQMQLRSGEGTIETVNVMITDFTKSITKRGTVVDLWNVSITLREV